MGFRDHGQDKTASLLSILNKLIFRVGPGVPHTHVNAPLDSNTKEGNAAGRWGHTFPTMVPPVSSLAPAQSITHVPGGDDWIHSFIHSFKHLLSTSYVPGIVLGAWEGAVNKTDQNLVMEDRQ